MQVNFRLEQYDEAIECATLYSDCIASRRHEAHRGDDFRGRVEAGRIKSSCHLFLDDPEAACSEAKSTLQLILSAQSDGEIETERSRYLLDSGEHEKVVLLSILAAVGQSPCEAVQPALTPMTRANQERIAAQQRTASFSDEDLTRMKDLESASAELARACVLMAASFLVTVQSEVGDGGTSQRSGVSHLTASAAANKAHALLSTALDMMPQRELFVGDLAGPIAKTARVLHARLFALQGHRRRARVELALADAMPFEGFADSVSTEPEN